MDSGEITRSMTNDCLLLWKYYDNRTRTGVGLWSSSTKSP